jgi:hypothetical protein
MLDIVVNFLKEKGVSEDIINQITPHLDGVTNPDQLKGVLEQFKDKLPAGIMDQLPSMPDMASMPMMDKMSDAGGILNKAKEMLGGIFGK